MKTDQDTSNNALQIDIKEVIKNRNPKLAKRLPGFIMRYIQKVLHQDDINKTLREQKDKYGIDFVNAVINDFEIKVVTKNEEKMPKSGRFIFVANHPLGAIESHVMMKVIHKYFPNIKFLVNDLLLNLKNYDPLFIPINKLGSQSREATKLIDETYASDVQILYFPAGLVSRKSKGVIKDSEWKKSFINKAVTHKRDIVPIYLEGRNTNFFYNVANIRKFLGIKANIEMFYLPREMYRQKGKTITLYLGDTIPYTKFDKSKTPAQWADNVKNIVYNIPHQSNS